MSVCSKYENFVYSPISKITKAQEKKNGIIIIKTLKKLLNLDDEEAIGIAAALHQESGWDNKTINTGGYTTPNSRYSWAVGIFQWLTRDLKYDYHVTKLGRAGETAPKNITDEQNKGYIDEIVGDTVAVQIETLCKELLADHGTMHTRYNNLKSSAKPHDANSYCLNWALKVEVSGSSEKKAVEDYCKHVPATRNMWNEYKNK